MRKLPILLSGCLLLFALAPAGNAHFRLLEPASWLDEGPLGDPQWSGPCGGTSTDPGKPTGKVTSVRGGDKLHIKVQEMAFHPGGKEISVPLH